MNEFFSMVLLFKWNLIASIFLAPALALLGCHLAARDRAMQSVCMSQGAMAGVLLGLGAISLFPRWEGLPIPVLSGFGVATATYWLTEHVALTRVSSRNTFFALIFSILLALGYLMTALFPALENHMSQAFFGDLATLVVKDAQYVAVLGIVSLSLLIANWKPFSNESFNQAILNQKVNTKEMFRALSLILIVASVQWVGFLFTVALLFLPTGMLSFGTPKGLRRHFIKCALFAVLSTIIGFLLSLEITRLPTVPTIILVAAFLLSMNQGFRTLFEKAMR